MTLLFNFYYYQVTFVNYDLHKKKIIKVDLVVRSLVEVLG